MQATNLSELVHKVLSPYVDLAGPEGSLRAEIDGPEIMVSAESATSVALIVHELATNAAKYGALSLPDGRIQISWVVTKGRFALSWKEIGGPRITSPPKQEGFGTVLIRRSVSTQLAGDLVFHWNPDGLVVLLSAQLKQLAL